MKFIEVTLDTPDGPTSTILNVNKIFSAVPKEEGKITSLVLEVGSYTPTYRVRESYEDFRTRLQNLRSS